MNNSPKIFSLKQVLSSIKKTLENRYSTTYWVKAEMHKLNLSKKGHCYPELLEKENGRIVAEMRGIIWKTHFDRINKRFIEVVKEPLKDDITLLLLVKIEFSETFGLSLNIVDIDPNYSLGEIQKERQETLKRLQKEGIINANHNQVFPLLPKRIAVISAEGTKGLSDFLKVLNQNSWGYTFFTMLFHASMQGDFATQTIVAQLKKIEKVKEHFDLVVIVRGGGGEVGLSCYNQYDLCAAIAQFPLPIITGIGHSTNFTVAEMIAFRNAITPTELGNFLIQSFHEFSVPVNDAVKAIRTHSASILQEEKNELNSVSRLFKSVVKENVSKNKQFVHRQQNQLSNNFRFYMLNRANGLKKNEQNVYQNAHFLLQNQKTQLRQLTVQIPNDVKTLLTLTENKINLLEKSVALMDPIHVLKRGYSITTINGKSIKTADLLRKGDKIETKTANFSLKSTISEIIKENE